MLARPEKVDGVVRDGEVRLGVGQTAVAQVVHAPAVAANQVVVVKRWAEDIPQRVIGLGKRTAKADPLKGLNEPIDGRQALALASGVRLRMQLLRRAPVAKCGEQGNQAPALRRHPHSGGPQACAYLPDQRVLVRHGYHPTLGREPVYHRKLRAVLITRSAPRLQHHPPATGPGGAALKPRGPASDPDVRAPDLPPAGARRTCAPKAP